MPSNRWYAGSVAGVTLQNSGGIGCRIDVEGAGAFLATTRSTYQPAADGTPHFQFGTTNTKGLQFSVIVQFITSTNLAAVIAAINTAMAAGNTFNVTLSNGVVSINNDCVMLGAGPEIGPAPGLIVKPAKFVFISKS